MLEVLQRVPPMARQSDTVSMNCMDMTWLALDSINERIVFHAILVIEGEVDASRLNDALLTTVRRHPALRTVLRRKLLRHYREYRDDIDPQILEVHDMTSSGGDPEHKRYLTEWVNRPLDPKKELPFRILLLKRGRANTGWRSPSIITPPMPFGPCASPMR
jgi:hypothetical protein